MAESSVPEPAGRGPGRPFPKGVSGNPGGRPRSLAEVEGLARKRAKAAIVRLTELMASDDERVALAASVALLDRGYGRPRQFDDERIKHLVEERLKALIAEAEERRRQRLVAEAEERRRQSQDKTNVAG